MENNQEQDSTFKVALKAVGFFLHTCKNLALNLPQRDPFDHDSSETAVMDKGQLFKLEMNLEAIRAALKRADDLSLSDDFDRLWVRELRYVEYCAEDVVEKIQFEWLRVTRLAQFKNELIYSWTGKRKRMPHALFPSLSSSLEERIETITDRYQEIARHRNALHFGADVERRPQPSRFIQSSSLIKSKLHGRNNEKEKVIGLLLSDDNIDEPRYSVIPIVGMAGIGKTTLAQHVYQEEIVQSNFDLKIWVWVSQQSGVIGVARKIVQSIENVTRNVYELEPLHRTIVGHLKGKKFLLVLDDMWDEDLNNWNNLQAPFNGGEKGSKVIVTTRSIRVSQMFGQKRFHLSCLSDDICWLICSERAFFGRQTNLDPNMVEIGKTAVARCKGLPLAAEAIGAALSISYNENHWIKVSENSFWLENEVTPAIRVGYDCLPLHLKRCFAYCSLFPKGYIFHKDVLVQLWAAQGFFQAHGSSSLEEIGGNCFDDLVKKCFFQHAPFHCPTEERFVMHELYHELAQDVSGIEFNRTEDNKLHMIDEKARHSSLVPQESHSMEEIQLGCFGGHELRTFLFVAGNEQERISFRMKLPRGLFMKLQGLRVLDLSNTDIQILPIENLIHLRYISVENTGIRTLPEAIGGLFNLQTLNLRRCNYLEELPVGIKLLISLRHLYLPLSETCSLLMPCGLGQMTELQTLPMFVVLKKNDACGIEELGSLVNLRGELHIMGIESVSSAQLAKQAKLVNKAKLQKLTLEWSMADSHIPTREEEEIVSDVLGRLRPHPNIEELIIKGFYGTNFPSWLWAVYLMKLVALNLKDCKRIEKLPPIGRLPSLKHLTIRSMEKLKCIGSEFCGNTNTNRFYGPGFPVLESLVFKKMDAWEEWSGVESGDFPCLKYLSINNCEKLTSLPRIWSLINLKVIRCPSLTPSCYEPSSPMNVDCSLYLVLSECGRRFEEEAFDSYQEIGKAWSSQTRSNAFATT
ncbi:hypothetical protein LUZ60_003566 [Juncus effusus]|nr:hypothetical protein LUZ60_003566 [Juncus effusus]